MTDPNLNTLNQYFQFRRAGDTNACLQLMSPDVVLVSQKDGTFQGKDGLRQYLQKNPFQGEWNRPYYSPVDRCYRADGLVKIFFLPVRVKILCDLNSEGLIKKVWIGRL